MKMRNKFAIVLALGALALAPVDAQATTVVVGGDVVDVGNTLPNCGSLPQGACFEDLCAANPQIALSCQVAPGPRPARVGDAERASGIGR